MLVKWGVTVAGVSVVGGKCHSPDYSCMLTHV